MIFNDLYLQIELVLKLEQKITSFVEITMVDINSLRSELKKFSEQFVPNDHCGAFLKELGSRIWNIAVQMRQNKAQLSEVNVHGIVS